jgi:hypothetical protein
MVKNKFGKRFEKISIELTPWIIGVLILLLCINSMNLWKQIHVLDSLHNFYSYQTVLNELTNKTITLTDTGSDGVTRDLDVYYRSSINSLHLIYLQGIVLAFLLGMAIRYLYSIKGGKK